MIDYTNEIKNSKVLVTGGLGFVGSNLVKFLVNVHKCEVVVVDDCSNGTINAIDEVVDQVKFHKMDVCEPAVFELFKNVDYIFHLACMQISSSGSEPNRHLKVNAESTLNMLEYIRHNDLQKLKRFVYTSSASIYGSSVKLPVSEDDPVFVLSNYAATKLLGEQFTLMYSRNYGISTSSVRYSNVYGPGQTPQNPYCGVLGRFIHNALCSEPLSVIGDGEQTRDYTYIDDAVKATILAAVHPRAFGDVFNIGTSIETSVNQLVSILKDHNSDLEIINLPERDIDNIRRRSIDITKIHNNLGWSPIFNVKNGIKLTLEWYKKFLS